MNSEIIQSVAYVNCNDFQYLNIMFSQKSFPDFQWWNWPKGKVCILWCEKPNNNPIQADPFNLHYGMCK